MRAGASYGVVLGLVLSVLLSMNNPMAWAIFWAVQAILLTTYASLTWQRTRLFWVTLGGAHGALVSAAMVPASMLGFDLRSPLGLGAAIFYANALCMPVWVLTARIAHREQFGHWKQHMDHMGLRDLLMFRHIPYFR
jgi:hypothetical protein